MRIVFGVVLLMLQLVLFCGTANLEKVKTGSSDVVKRAARSVGEEESLEEKRVFGSITKPLGKHHSGRPSSQEQPIEISDSKRSDEDYYELLNELMNRQIESKRPDFEEDPDEGFEAEGGSPDAERGDMLHLAMMQGQRGDDNDVFESYDKRPFGPFTRKLSKRPFGPLTGRYSKRPFGSMTGQVKRPFGSMISGFDKRPFGSFSSRPKKPFGSMSRVLNKRPFGSFTRPQSAEEPDDDIEKRPFGSFTRPSALDSDVNKRPFGSFSRPRSYDKRGSDDVEKRPFGSFTRPHNRYAIEKRPFGSFTRWSSRRGKRGMGAENEMDSPLFY